MRKLKTLAATAAIMAGATLSLTMLASAATVKFESPAYYSDEGYYIKSETSANVEKFCNSYNQRAQYAKFYVDEGKAKTEGCDSYKYTYKTATAILRNGNNTSSKFKDGTSLTVTTEKPKLNNNLIATSATFIGAIYNGTESTDKDVTGYVIYVNNS